MSVCSYWKFSSIWWNYSKYWILICLDLESTNSFKNMHQGPQVLNLTSLIAWVRLEKIPILMLFPCLAWYDQLSKNEERSREGIDISPNVDNTDLVHMSTIISNSKTYHYRESTPPYARHQQTTPVLPEARIDGYMLLQEQTSTNRVLETAHKIISTVWAPQTKRK